MSLHLKDKTTIKSNYIFDSIDKSIKNDLSIQESRNIINYMNNRTSNISEIDKIQYKKALKVLKHE